MLIHRSTKPPSGSHQYIDAGVKVIISALLIQSSLIYCAQGPTYRPIVIKVLLHAFRFIYLIFGLILEMPRWKVGISHFHYFVMHSFNPFKNSAFPGFGNITQITITINCHNTFSILIILIPSSLSAVNISYVYVSFFSITCTIFCIFFLHLCYSFCPRFTICIFIGRFCIMNKRNMNFQVILLILLYYLLY